MLIVHCHLEGCQIHAAKGLKKWWFDDHYYICTIYVFFNWFNSIYEYSPVRSTNHCINIDIIITRKSLKRNHEINLSVYLKSLTVVEKVSDNV